MKESTKAKLRMAQQYCDDEDKSTEFMLQYMQHVAEVDLNCVLNFIFKGYRRRRIQTETGVKTRNGY